MKFSYFCAPLCVLVLASPTWASISVNGKGKVELTPSNQMTARDDAFRKAREDAIFNALEKMVDKKTFSEERRAIEKVKDQYRNFVEKEEVTGEDRDGNLYILELKMTIDDIKLKNELADQGVEAKAAGTRSGSIMILIDEYYQKPTNLDAAPKLAKETHVIDYSRDNSQKGSSASSKAAAYSATHDDRVGYSDKRSIDAKASDKASYKGSAESSANYNASASENMVGRGGSYSGDASSRGSASSASNVDAKRESSQSLKANKDTRYSASSQGSVAASSASARSSSYDKKDKESYKQVDIIEYQPDPSTRPQKVSYVERTLAEVFGKQDFKLLDRDQTQKLVQDAFGKSVTTTQILGDETKRAKLLEIARKARADFVMLGNAFVFDNGMEGSSAFAQAVVDARIFSTASGQLVASGSGNEESKDSSTDGAKQTAAKKAGTIFGNELAQNALNYWKKRTVSGVEYTLIFEQIPSDQVKRKLAKAIRTIQGVKAGDDQYESKTMTISLQYKGADNFKDALLDELDKDQTFAILKEKNSAGNQITYTFASTTKESSASKSKSKK